MLELLKQRRSIRNFTQEAVTDEQVSRLLEAAMAAPTAHNLQPWQFIIVRDRATRAALAETHEFSAPLREAAVCSDSSSAVHWLEDACVAAENILIEAVDLKLGCTWVAVYPHIDHEAYVRGVLSIPEHIRVICLIPVGYPAEEKPPRTQFDSSKIHSERFGTAWNRTRLS
jgi:nitroreductase